jgi:hypothetical protein
MPRNGSGTYSLPVGNPVVTGTTISSTWANNTLTDISNALTGSLSADGQTTASGNLNMGTNRVINMDDPQNAQDAATKYYVDQLIAALGTMAYQNANNVAITGGTVNNVSINLSTKTDETYLPVGPTILRTVSPINGLIRYNTDGKFYEGYQDGVWIRFVTAPQGEYTITYVIIAGGGGGAGGTGGGGGAGGMLQSTFTAIPDVTYTLAIGGGGGTNTSGSNSYITGIATATGGGNGGASNNSPNAGNGGSGGGQGINQYGGSPGVGIAGQGFGGGAGSAGAASFNGAAGGGGGAGAAGASAPSAQTGGAGGAGQVTTITGTSLTFAGGGGGAADQGNPLPTGGAGGSGGGGGGSAGYTPGGNGLGNTGSGGGGGQSTGGSGGSGLIYISMPTVNFSGNYTGLPTITTSGLNTILKYVNSGTYKA